MRPSPLVHAAAFLLVAAAGGQTLSAAGVALDAEHSVLAVLTHKAGIASGLAHDHLVTAPLDALRLEFDAAAPEATRATLDLAVERLEIDHFAARANWKVRLRELGAGPEKLDPVTEEDRGKVREAMLGKSQLDAAGSPRLTAELVKLEKADGMKPPFDGRATIRLTIRGKTVERAIPATWRVEGSGFTVEALGEFRFTEFGIRPYSAALGAVKNDDLFHLYVALASK